MNNWLVWTVTFLAFAESPSGRHADETRLAELASAIRSADYRGERAELRRLAPALDEVATPSLLAYREYWRGFASWRRALNGFSETPRPADLREDLEAAVRSFEAALAHEPLWIEAQLGLVGCWGSLIYLAGADSERRQAILARAGGVVRAVDERGRDNPRALWLLAGRVLSAPPPTGGDAVRAAATYRRGLKAARAESLRAEKPAAWVPAWGAAENLMGLAYVHAQGALTQRDVARAYAEGALALVPDWHYVRDVLVPQIEALPAGPK